MSYNLTSIHPESVEWTMTNFCSAEISSYSSVDWPLGAVWTHRVIFFLLFLFAVLWTDWSYDNLVAINEHKHNRCSEECLDKVCARWNFKENDFKCGKEWNDSASNLTAYKPTSTFQASAITWHNNFVTNNVSLLFHRDSKNLVNKSKTCHCFTFLRMKREQKTMPKMLF